MLDILKSLFGIGIAGTLITLLTVLIKSIVNSGLYNPDTFPNVVVGTLSNMNAWGGSLGGVISAMLGILLVFVTMRIVVTLL